jgi:hypothetical protein
MQQHNNGVGQPVSKLRVGKNASTTIVIVGNGVFYSVRAKFYKDNGGNQFS